MIFGGPDFRSRRGKHFQGWSYVPCSLQGGRPSRAHTPIIQYFVGSLWCRKICWIKYAEFYGTIRYYVRKFRKLTEIQHFKLHQVTATYMYDLQLCHRPTMAVADVSIFCYQWASTGIGGGANPFKFWQKTFWKMSNCTVKWRLLVTVYRWPCADLLFRRLMASRYNKWQTR